MNIEEFKQEFAKRLKKQAYRSGEYNQKQIAEMTGISEATIGYYFNAQRLPNADNLVRLTQALHCSADDLIMIDERLE